MVYPLLIIMVTLLKKILQHTNLEGILFIIQCTVGHICEVTVINVDILLIHLLGER